MIARPTARSAALLVAALLLVATAITAVAGGSDLLLDALMQRPRAASGVAVVPDRFLRSWDPVTVFFPADQVPAAGPGDVPQKVRLDPDHPGAWTWLDRRTVQFRPAEPWPPLDGVTVRVGGDVTFLSTLSSPPIGSSPADGAEGLSPVQTVTLTFAQPVDPDILARMTQLELRPLPGIGAGPATRLGRDAFEVKVLDRADAREPARYSLVLREPIPLGQRVTVRLALSQDQAAAEATAELRFSTAEPFRPVALGCDGQTVPISPEGTQHPSERPLRCTGQRAVRVSFTSSLGAVSAIDGRNLVRFEPAVDDLQFEANGRDLVVRGSFLAEVPYQVSVAPAPFADSGGRLLEIADTSTVYLYFPRREAFLRWTTGQGVAERFGPKRVPADGRGLGTADLRIYAVDPLNRNLWPFPERPVAIDEAQRPPGPGEQPPAWDNVAAIPQHELQRRLGALGSPAYSGIVELPLDTGTAATGAHFGLDVSGALQRISGADAPGHYLVGLRRMDGGTERAWVRLQVTDLALATVESATDVQFQVTSLRTGDGVAGARIRVEGDRRGDWTVLYEGRTGSDGLVRWAAPGWSDPPPTVRRIVVDKGDDVLVIDPSHAPDRFVDGSWLPTGETWLQWAFQRLDGREEPPQTLVHLFPDRPIYRPGDEVHLKGWIRQRHRGRLSAVTGTGRIVVTGPSGAEWPLPVELSGEGSFHAVWKEDEPPTGGYRARYETAQGVSYGQTTFQVEAYRLPTFEVLVDGPDGATTVPNDRAFDVTLGAAYYAGGPVAVRPVRWRVTQFPLAWLPPKAEAWDGFVWSSDDRYARGGGFRATPELTEEVTTAPDGSAKITLDPGIEADGRPRTYAVEATVTGADDQTVTATTRVDAVPAFVLGLSAPRYLPKADTIPAQVVALGPDGRPVAGLDLTVRLIQRQWHSVLQATDFTSGEAQYLTDVVDVPRDERAVKSAGAASKVPLPVAEPGVYWVEVEARDALGRVQVVRLDLYAGGEGAVGWEKAEAGTFALSPDRPRYRPGQTANVVIRSPFQEGRALVIVEAPDGNQYREVAVRGGQATASIPVQTGWVPRVPVHVVLRRGRGAQAAVGAVDTGKPQTVASTVWLPIEPVENRVEVTVAAPERALPGATVPVTVSLADPDGKPLSGEVTLWLVDQAVLALGKEQRLDPLPDFITDRRSRTAVRDTRNQVLGAVPTAPMPGGDGEEAKMAEEAGVLEGATVRKNLKALAYYEPTLRVPASGKVTVQVPLPDNLTVFKIRAKAVSGAQRFGVGTGQIAVRLPVVAQPALPRFVRPGDRFDAAAIARVVEGEGGAGAAEIAVSGLTLAAGAQAKQAVTLSTVEAARIGWPVVVQTPPIGEGGALARGEVTVKVGVRRAADGASDAIETVLPVRDDRRPRYTREVFTLAPGQSAEAAAIPEAARPGSVRRTVVLGGHEALVRMASALDVMRNHTPRGTDEVLSRANVAVGLGALRGPLGLEDDAEIRGVVLEAQAWLPTVLDRRGLVAQYPGADGRVWLTAEALAFLSDAGAQGYPADPRLKAALEASLTASLRSDYRYFLDGESWWERTMALRGLAWAGKFDEPYFAELGRNTKFLVPEAQAGVLVAASRAGKAKSALGAQIAERLSGEILLELFQGKPRYAGLQGKRSDRTPRIAPSEARELATIARGLGAARPDDDKLGPVVDALIRLGAEDGWGQSNADAAALLALAEAMPRLAKGGASINAAGAPLVVSAAAPVARSTSTAPGKIALKNSGTTPAVVVVLSRWIPEAPGSAQAPEQKGFVVEREWIVVPASGASARTALSKGGEALAAKVGTVIEEHVRVVNPEERYDVIVTVPLAAGMEPLNPALATSGPEARPSNASTGAPTWVSFGDDRALYAFDKLPKGTIDLYFRTRATLPGTFVQPAATAEMVYDRKAIGLSAGAEVRISP